MNRLIIAGSGIQFLTHLTYQTKIAIEKCSYLMFLVHDPATKNWLNYVKPGCKSLDAIYYAYESREESYNAVASAVINTAKKINNSLFLIYGHPTIFSSVTSKIIEKAKDVEIEIYPGISALDCLLADLKIDPGYRGIQSFDATEFILYNHIINPYSHMIIWQPAVIGHLEIIKNDIINLERRKIATSLLKARLENCYESNHPIYIYEASNYPGVNFYSKKVCLSTLLNESLPRLSSLYIPPLKDIPKNTDAFKILGIK